MWFAIPPLMVTIKKPRCSDTSSDLCMKDCVAGGSEFLRIYEATAGVAEDDLSKLHKDASCAKCFPDLSGKGKGCGGIGLSKNEILVSNVVSVSGTIIIR
eukprot:315269-Rhodomonas_salina.1